MLRCNGARGEVVARLGGADVRLCVTLRSLAELESHFGVSGFDALGARLKAIGAGDLRVVLQALAMDAVPADVGFAEAIRAVVQAFEAMNALD